jgi:FlaA1/EpsC-like NDP-sugar epimerase
MKNILVTGGSGTIGSFVCRELLSRGMTPVSFIRNAGKQLTSNPGVAFEIGDIKDKASIICAMRKHDIEGVVHCAANKHLMVCQNHPTECIKTNVLGVINVLEAIEESGCNIRSAVFMSTDKACNAETTYGLSKYLGEGIVSDFTERLGIRLNSIRMGNVMGSSGSVIRIWHGLIKEGVDITLRKKGMLSPRRFVITPREASSFIVDVLMSGDFENGSIVFPECKVLDIGDLAEVMSKNGGVSTIVEQMSSTEGLEESMYSLKEMPFLRKVGGAFEIGNSQEIGTIPIVSRTTRDGEPILKNEVEKFYLKVLKEVGLWAG